jgi:hypothetical protein
MAFMPEVTFSGAPPLPSPAVEETGSRAVLTKREPGEAEAAIEPPTTAPAAARLRDHPLAAIMSLSEEERIALFT